MLNPLDWGSRVYLVLIVAALTLHFLVPRSAEPARRLLGEALLVAPAALLYFLVRGLVAPDSALAMRHAAEIIRFERRLGIFQEPRIQAQVVERGMLIDLANWIYVGAHWPLLAAVITWLVLRHHAAYPRYRNAMLLSGVAGIAVFFLFPVAPPRLLPQWGFVDTVALHSHSYRVLQPPVLTDPYASMPSLHLGWNLLAGLALLREGRTWYGKAFGALSPAAMYAAIVATANHFFVDGLAGMILVLVALVTATWLEGRFPPAQLLWARRRYPPSDDDNGSTGATRTCRQRPSG